MWNGPFSADGPYLRARMVPTWNQQKKCLDLCIKHANRWKLCMTSIDKPLGETKSILGRLGPGEGTLNLVANYQAQCLLDDCQHYKEFKRHAFSDLTRDCCQKRLSTQLCMQPCGTPYHKILQALSCSLVLPSSKEPVDLLSCPHSLIQSKSRTCGHHMSD